MTAEPALVIVGPTASNKSALAMEIARVRGDVEIVSVDSMCVYRGMDIGTAKPSADDRELVPHHLIDIVDPHECFSAAWFAAEAHRAMEAIATAERRSILVGGTGLYHRAVIDELDIPPEFPEARAEIETEASTEQLHRRLADLDPGAAARMESSNRRRIVRALEVTVGSGRPFSSFGPGLDRYPPTNHTLVGLATERDGLEPAIRARWERQMAAGFLDEVRRLWDADEPPGRTASQALGYRELHEHLSGRFGVDQASERAIARTRQFAVRQIRWFTRDPRVRWVDAPASPSETASLAAELATTVF